TESLPFGSQPGETKFLCMGFSARIHFGFLNSMIRGSVSIGAFSKPHPPMLDWPARIQISAFSGPGKGCAGFFTSCATVEGADRQVRTSRADRVEKERGNMRNPPFRTSCRERSQVTESFWRHPLRAPRLRRRASSPVSVTTARFWYEKSIWTWDVPG